MTPTNTVTPSITVSSTPTITPTITPTTTTTITPTQTTTPTSTVTPTPTTTNTTTPTITPTQTITPTSTVTPTPSVTLTPTVTPTITKTPSQTPTAVTGYSFNLVALPYNFPSSGNSIMNGAAGVASTDPNVLATGGRGFYFNSIDSGSVDRTNYYSTFTGQSVTITLSQTGSTAVYSGDTNSFKQWIQSPMGSGFVFGAVS